MPVSAEVLTLNEWLVLGAMGQYLAGAGRRNRLRKMIQNFRWAGGYTILAIPLAAGVLYSWGILLDLAVGAIPMSLSAVIVALNAPLLRTVSL